MWESRGDNSGYSIFFKLVMKNISYNKLWFKKVKKKENVIWRFKMSLKKYLETYFSLNFKLID